RDYELVFIISPEIMDESVPAVIERINNFITEKGGTVSENKQWGRRKLAYPIKKVSEGNYILTNFQGPPELLTALDKNLKLSEDVLRHLVIKLDEQPVSA
ncbi:MAG: 30S ribosomal protein S6, partial [Dehalococcoidia bacterium]|nr:30S ribosomal protein S6 [Dehalococcoidia bacterium]